MVLFAVFGWFEMTVYITGLKTKWLATSWYSFKFSHFVFFLFSLQHFNNCLFQWLTSVTENCKYGKYDSFFILRCSSSGNVLPSLVLWLAFYVTAHQLFRQDFTDRLRGRLKQIASNPEQQIYLKLRPFFFLVLLNTGQIIDIINNSKFKL